MYIYILLYNGGINSGVVVSLYVHLALFNIKLIISFAFYQTKENVYAFGYGVCVNSNDGE